jgi:hypothetical protein
VTIAHAENRAEDRYYFRHRNNYGALVQHRAATLCAATDCDKITLRGLNSPRDVKQLTQNSQMTKKSIYNF